VTARMVYSACRICTATCGIIVHVENDRVVRVAGDPDHPLSHGYTCSKGRALPAVHHSSDRLDHPELRGTPATWDETMADLAMVLRRVVDEHGPDAVASYRSYGWANDCNARYATDAFLRALGTSQIYSSTTLDLPNKRLVPQLMMGTDLLFPLVDWDHASLLVYVGGNPVVSHGHGAGTPDPIVRLRALRARGGSVVVIDPRTTETAHMADLHIAPRPGTDAALLACAVRAVLAERPDRRYLDAYVSIESLARLTSAVNEYDLDTTAAICDVKGPELQHLIDIVLAHPRLSIQTGTGLSMGATANVAEWMAWALTLVTGSLDRVGGTVFNPGFLHPMEGGVVVRPWVTGPPPVSHPEQQHRFGELPSAVLSDEILDGPVKALLVVGGNPARVFPDSAKTERALRSLEALAVVEVRRTATTALATHLLPVGDQFERADIPAYVDTVVAAPFGQYLPQVVPLGAERRDGWRVMAELAQRMGLKGPDPLGDGEELLRRASSRARVEFEELKQYPSGLLIDDVPGPGWLIPGALATERIDIAPASLIEQLTTWRRAFTSSALVLVNRRLPHQMNSMLQEVPGQRRGAGPTLLMHPDDAGARGLVDGMQVAVSALHGATIASLEIGSSIRRGVVSLPHAFGAPNVNLLTSSRPDALDPLTGMPIFTGVAVAVTPVG
jgi:anaerobic selenocysteine-containing dehydrogenase